MGYYMTLPPVVEIRESFRRTPNSGSNLAAWYQSGSPDPIGSWKGEVFRKLERLERGPDVPGLGNLRLSEAAAAQLRLQLAGVSLQSLPFPSVVGISGQGAQLDWRTGERMVEVIAFADGELVIEATDRGTPVEFEETEGLETYLEWLVGAADRPLVYATAR